MSRPFRFAWLICAVCLCMFVVSAYAQKGQKPDEKPSNGSANNEDAEPADSSRSYLEAYLFNIGGSAWVQTATSRPVSNLSAKPLSNINVSFGPRVAYFLSRQVSIGAEFLVSSTQITSNLTAYNGRNRRERYLDNQFSLRPQLTLYQPVVPRLYVFERLAVGPGVGKRTVSLVDSLSTTVAEQGYSTTSAEAVVSAGFAVFFRQQLAFSGQLGYLFAIDHTKAYGPTSLGPGTYTQPTGTYRRQGVEFRLGIEIFLHAKPFK